MKDLGKTKYCLGLQLEHRPLGILVHQSSYIQKILEKFNMDKSYPNKTPMVVRSLEIGKDPFRPRDIGEKMLGPEISYLSVIGALIYLANYTKPDIAFAVNLLARHSADPTRRHWTGAKCILRYLNGTKNLGLFFKKNHDPSMIGYTDAGYLSDPHNGKSQTRFVFLHGGTVISWKLNHDPRIRGRHLLNVDLYQHHIILFSFTSLLTRFLVKVFNEVIVT